MKIGNIEIKGYAALAPMAGVADRAMRELCRYYGAAFTVGELTSSVPPGVPTHRRMRETAAAARL